MEAEKKLENWQVEIKRLDIMRLNLGLNWNQLEKIVGKNRLQLQRFFEFTNVPSMKFYFDVKIALENQFEVKFKDVVICSEFKTIECDCKVENGLLKRGKIKCSLSKEQHKG